MDFFIIMFGKIIKCSKKWAKGHTNNDDFLVLGYATQTLYTISCAGWTASQAIPMNNLSYEYYIGYKGVPTSTQLIYFGVNTSSGPIYLPLGDHSDSYWASVYAYVLDALLDATLYTANMDIQVHHIHLWKMFSGLTPNE